MNDNVYNLIEFTASSTTSVEDAIVRAVQRAYQTIKTLCWLQVVETRDRVTDENGDHWKATIKVGFTVDG